MEWEQIIQIIRPVGVGFGAGFNPLLTNRVFAMYQILLRWKKKTKKLLL